MNNSHYQRLTLTLGYVVTALWAVSFMLDVFIPEYDPPPAIHAAMMIVAGALFGRRLMKNDNGRPDL